MDGAVGPQLLRCVVAVALNPHEQSLCARRGDRRGPGDRMGGREGPEQDVCQPVVRSHMTLCLVTDRRQLDPDARTERECALTLARWLEEAVGAGIDLIQLRERDLPARLLCDLARTVAGVASGTRTRVVVNDRADVALAAGCNGVHLPGDAPPVARVRALARGSAIPVWLVGRSVHDSDEARANADADYLLFGAVYDSGPKPGRGLDALREAVSAVGTVSRPAPVPVIAIGGVTVPRAAECVAAGAAGVAAIRLFLPPGRATGALGISAAAAALRGAFDRAATGHLQ